MKHTRYTKALFIWIAVMACLSVMPASQAQISKATVWQDAVISDLNIDFVGTGFHARWKFHRCHCGDLLVQVEQVAPDGLLTGELMLIDGQILLSKGFEAQGTDIAPLMQAPSLMLQLSYQLLNRIHSQGPFDLDQKQTWDVEEAEHSFELNTGMAIGSFPAPWHLTGSGWKADQGQRRIELVFDFNAGTQDNPDQQSTISFSGALDYRKQGFPYPEASNMTEWRMQWISMADDESKPVPEDTTLKALREQASEY